MKCKKDFCNINEPFTILLKGDPGKEGPKGAIGRVGDIGLRGLDGKIGPQGPQGDQGIQGVAGFKGDRGLQGSRGTTGPRGSTGAIGVQGPRGDKGPKGPKGIRGQQGDKGEAGASGVPGVKGKKGSSGSQFSNTTIGSLGSCEWKENIDHLNSMMGDESKAANYCPEGYAMSGIKTSAWENTVREYTKKCRYSVYMGIPSTTCWTTPLRTIGTQIQREYSMKCCPTISPSTVDINSLSDNLDDYKKYSSIRKYPFHKP